MAQNIHLREDQKDGWFIFALNYLRIAELACVEMLKNEDADHYEEFSIQDLYIATIYNTKHAIEIILKELKISLDGSFSEGHDSRKLLEELEHAIEYKRGVLRVIIERVKKMMQHEQFLTEVVEEKKKLISTGKMTPHEAAQWIKELIFKGYVPNLKAEVLALQEYNHDIDWMISKFTMVLKLLHKEK